MDDDVFQMLFKIILREYPHAKAGKAGDSLSQGDGEGGIVKAIRPIQNPAPLFDFMNLPAETLRPIFQSVLDGKMDLKTARKDARECKSGLKMANAFEKRFNALAGNQCKSRDKNWISFKSIVDSTFRKILTCGFQPLKNKVKWHWTPNDSLRSMLSKRTTCLK